MYIDEIRWRRLLMVVFNHFKSCTDPSCKSTFMKVYWTHHLMDIRRLSNRYIAFCSHTLFREREVLHLYGTIHSQPDNHLFDGLYGVTSGHRLINDAISVPCYPTRWLDIVKIIMIICPESFKFSFYGSDLFSLPCSDFSFKSICVGFQRQFWT